MEPETEQLFRTWLKAQIWKQRISMISSVVITALIIFSLWFSTVYFLPMLKKQLENTSSLLNQLTPANQSKQIQQDLLKNLPN